MRTRPVAAREVAQHLVKLASGPAQGMAPDLAGPRVEQLVDMVRQLLRARGERRVVVPVRMPGAVGAAMTGTGCCRSTTVGLGVWRRSTRGSLGVWCGAGRRRYGEDDRRCVHVTRIVPGPAPGSGSGSGHGPRPGPHPRVAHGRAAPPAQPRVPDARFGAGRRGRRTGDVRPLVRAVRGRAAGDRRADGLADPGRLADLPRPAGVGAGPAGAVHRRVAAGAGAARCGVGQYRGSGRTIPPTGSPSTSPSAWGCWCCSTR